MSEEKAKDDKLHKVLANAGLGSRREMENFIAQGRITVNDKVANIGIRVTRQDKIVVDGKPFQFPSLDDHAGNK